jgi:hypothetical protein
MDCVRRPAFVVGPTASWYAFAFVSVTETIRAVVSFQPTTTTFRFPADCAALNGTLTDVTDDCGVAKFIWTKGVEATSAGVAGMSNRSWSERPQPPAANRTVNRGKK